MGSAATIGCCVTEPDDWAFAPPDHVSKEKLDAHPANRMSANLFDRDAMFSFLLATVAGEETNSTFAKWVVNEKHQNVLVFREGVSL
jgi:hypothetical protein